MTDSSRMDVAVEVSVAESRRGLELQERTLEDLRGRAARLLSTGVAVAAVLGFSVTAVDERTSLTPAGWVVVAALVVLVGVSLRVQWPRTWMFVLDVDVLLDEEWLAAPGDGLVYRAQYAKELRRQYEVNELALRAGFRAYSAGVVAVGVEVVALVLALASS